MSTKIKVERVPRSVIENKLLYALESTNCVAILATEADLKLMIEALDRMVFHTKAREMAEDYRKLLNSAYP